MEGRTVTVTVDASENESDLAADGRTDGRECRLAHPVNGPPDRPSRPSI